MFDHDEDAVTQVVNCSLQNSAQIEGFLLSGLFISGVERRHTRNLTRPVSYGAEDDFLDRHFHAASFLNSIARTF